ncbi:MAG TPA: DUF6600 domain-containing protein [Candidatus Acidoferrales bacterium]|jgi:hypothetical protein|nr:DUF6600 domain-containing protein [Candidatus Acidoferrales bacterium]
MKLRTFVLGSALPVLACGVVACGLISAQGPPAQDQPGQNQSGQNQPDPPSRVGRLNYISGTVSFRPGSVEEWTAATLNYPLTTGDHLWADRESGAEIHIGSSVLHLADQTALAILNLDDKTAQLSLTQGAINVNIARIEADESFEVDTPNGAIVLLRPGSYRVDVNGDANSTALVVRTGEAEVTGGGQALPVHPRELLRFAGTDQLTTEALAAPAPDEFDRWCMDRDQREARALRASASYVPPEMIGAGDLADNGVWRNDPMYGAVWVPARVPVGWAPYRYGHWAFVRPWGWTWIDDMPWGFAPFHYGRWAMVGGGGWVWVPGTMVVRPVYAPAMVAFVGGSGFGMAIGVGGGGVAWIPLGPREVYRPYYHVSEAYVRNVNVTHVTNVTVVNVTNVTYVNRTQIVAVPQGAFTGARPVAAVAVRVSPEAMGRAQAVNVMEVRPVRESYMGRPAEPGRRFGAPPAQVMARPVVVRQALPDSVRPTGGVRVAAPVRQPGIQPGTQPGVQPGMQPGMQPGIQPGRPVNNAPAPQVENSRPPRNDRPPAVNSNRPPVNNTPNNTPSQPAGNPQTPQTESARPARNTPAPQPSIARPPANSPQAQPQPQAQQPPQQHQQQAEPAQHQAPEQRQRQKSPPSKTREKEEKEKKQ